MCTKVDKRLLPAVWLEEKGYTVVPHSKEFPKHVLNTRTKTLDFCIRLVCIEYVCAELVKAMHPEKGWNEVWQVLCSEKERSWLCEEWQKEIANHASYASEAIRREELERRALGKPLLLQ